MSLGHLTLPSPAPNMEQIREGNKRLWTVLQLMQLTKRLQAGAVSLEEEQPAPQQEVNHA